MEEAGVKGVIIKISEGCSLEETWWGHMYECEARGIPWGVYCYAHADTVEKPKGRQMRLSSYLVITSRNLVYGMTWSRLAPFDTM